MSTNRFPIGLKMDVFYPDFRVNLALLSETQLSFEIKEGPYARSETVDIQVVPLGNSMFAVSWQEKQGATVTNVQDYDRGRVHSFATLPGGQFLRMTGRLEITGPADRDFDDRPQRNKALVREAMSSLFQRHDASAVERLYAPDYIQHNPDIPQGRDALQALVADLSHAVFYEPGLVIAEGDFVAIHGRIRGWADTPQVVIDLFRVEGDRLAEHWDVLQNEVPAMAALGGTSMFDPEEGARSPTYSDIAHLSPRVDIDPFKKVTFMNQRDVVFPAGRQALYLKNRYSPAVRANGFLFVSGQVGSRPDGSPEPELEAQVRLAFENLNAVLAAAGCTFDDVVDVTVFIVDPETNFEPIWKLVPEYWGSAPHPTLTGIGVTWLYGFQFEIKVIAKLPENAQL